MVLLVSAMSRSKTVRLDAQAVERLRVERLMGISELTRLTRVSERTIFGARAGRPVSFAVAKAIARALRVELRLLLPDVPVEAGGDAGMGGRGAAGALATSLGLERGEP